jgi:outer membrane protein assembly factor BamB
MLATDAGRLGLFGVRLPGNRDALLFPWLKDHPALSGGARRGRALIAHADDASTWVLSHGELQRVDSTFTEKTGPGVTPRWADPPALGTPLHAAQTVVAEGRTILFLTTQAPDGADCYCWAVDAGSGRVLWRRQLGVVPVGAPVAWGKGVAFPDSGGLLLFHETNLSGAKQGWRSAGTRLVADANSQLIAVRADGSLLRLAWSEQTLSWQSFSADKGARAADGSATLPAPLAGTPALHADYVVAALTNGVVVRIDLAGSTATGATAVRATATSGPDWRSSGADEQAQAHVVALGQDVFAITDGSRGVQLVHWPEAKSWSKKGTATLAHRIVAPPAALGAPDMKVTSELRLVVADASDAVTVLNGAVLAGANLDKARRWTLSGKVSAGPLVCGPGIVCVLDGRRVVWLDPSAAMPLWEYPCAARIAGPPRWTNGKLLLADVSGAVTTLDPATGAATGAGYGAGFSFRGDVAPAATPLVLGDGRIVIPLSDGTLAVR